MYDFEYRIPDEIESLKFLIKEARKKLGRKKPGALSTKTVNGHVYYYESKMRNGKIRQRYLGTEDDDRLGEFIALKVLETRLRILKDDLAVLQEMKKRYRDYSSDTIISNLGDKYSTAFWGQAELEELEELQGRPAWEVSKNYHEAYEESESREFERDVITCDGKRVRSKGECIIYDILRMFHIDFIYEPDLVFYDEDYNPFPIHPDFYIECKDGSHIIIEHLGLLDKKDYAGIQEHKLRMYHINGYDLGHNFILTSDNSSFGLDSSFITDLIRHVILPRAKVTE